MKAIPVSGSNQATSIRRLYLRVLDKQGQHWMGYLGLMLMVAALQLPIPYLVSGLVDAISRREERDLLLRWIAGVAGLSSLSLLLATIGKGYAARISQRFQCHLRLAAFEALQMSPWSFVRHFDISDLRSRLTGDIETLHHLLPTGLVNTIRDILLLLSFGLLLIYQSPAIAGSIFIFLPLAILIFRLMGRRLDVLSSKARIRYAEANAAIHESLQSLPEARISKTGRFHLARLRAALQRGDEQLLAVHRHSAVMTGLLGLFPILITATIWVIGQAKVEARELSVGTLVSLFLLLSLLYSPLSALFGAASGAVYELAALRRIGALFAGSINGKNETMRGNDPVRPPALLLHDVTFSYEEKPVFSNLSVTIAAGRCTVLAGENGAGKSTLALMMLGLEQPSSGTAYLDGEDMSMARAQGSSAYVPQEVFIFADTLRANVTMGRDISDHQIHQLLQELGWDDPLFAAPFGLDWMIAEGGSRLSGGQRQKLALLRALVGKPGLLVLDEPEKNLDQHSLAQLVAYLERIKASTTIILISHGHDFAAIIDDTVWMPTNMAEK